VTAVVVVAAEPENGVKRRRKVAGSGSDTSQEGIERSYEEKGMLWMHPQHPGMTAEVYSGVIVVIVVAAFLGSDLGTTGSSPLEPVALTFHHPDPSAAAAGPAAVAVVDDVAASVAESAAAAFAPSSRVQRLLHSSPCFPQLRPLLGSELTPA